MRLQNNIDELFIVNGQSYLGKLNYLIIITQNSPPPTVAYDQMQQAHPLPLRLLHYA